MRIDWLEVRGWGYMGTKLKVEHVERGRILDDEKRHGRQERGNMSWFLAALQLTSA